MSQDTLYLAEPMFSETLQRFDSDTVFPPIKKIGITTGMPQRREKELLGTLSPVKVKIVKAWTNLAAREVESMLHTILDNTRLDGEYFWDGSENLVEAVSGFIERYHPEATEITIQEDADVQAATNAANASRERRIYSEVIPRLEALGIEGYHVTKGEKGVRFPVKDYRLHIGARTGGRYTMTIWSTSRTSNQALNDFMHAQEISSTGTEDSPRRARIPLSSLDLIMESLSHCLNPAPQE
ncbi:Meiotically Up-regulated Gene 113 (MUG113) protein [Modicisalibacter xianhensis]|uniref:Meiotically Up-regulated Gene 113 (MUG113) protein n=1 Tax=Modicisalibacter xianhensis TaxID=442341 RepID=A0A4R8FD20_9GAMM|nr:GIY-YIG nuclease family protein [Halomonas xianhensis]TDX23710.1 Meiotically Up-regulated Gene 113 (MUG113) protein [Halomonas xianhensis]